MTGIMSKRISIIVFIAIVSVLILDHSFTTRESEVVFTMLSESEVQNTATKYQTIVQRMYDACGTTHYNSSQEDLLCMDTPKFLNNYKNPCWLHANEILRCQPYFHLIGTAKCGTSDFFKRILMHPDILPNKGFLHKETGFWSRRRFGIHHDTHRWPRCKKKTFAMFTGKFDAAKLKKNTDTKGYHYKITGVGDPMDIYDRYHDDLMPQNKKGAEELQLTTPHVMKHMNPNVKLLLIIRDPIERLYSHYFHGKYGNSARSFHNDTLQSIDLWKNCLQSHTERHCVNSRALEVKYNSPIYPGFYNIHLREWLNAFPREQFLIFRNEDYAKDIRGTLMKVYKYLNISIPSEDILMNMSAMPHFRLTQAKYTSGPMLEETRTLLVKFYRPYLKDLAKLLSDDRYLFLDTNFR